MTANDGGAIDTTVTSSQPSAAGLAAGTFLNIHLAPAAQLGGPGSLGYTPISCADITPAASTAVTMAPPPQPGQHPQGSAKLTYDPAKKTLSVDATASGLVAGSAHAVHIHLGSCASQGAVKRVSLIGGSSGSCTAIAFAAAFPERVERLVLYGSYPDGAALTAPGVANAILAAVRAHWGLGSRLLSDIFLGGADSAERERFARFQREAATAETAAALLGLGYRLDVRAHLPLVRRPALVVHRRTTAPCVPARA